MAIEQIYRGYFVTIAAKDGVPHPIADEIYELLKVSCVEIDYVIEPHKNGKPHMHIMLYLKKPCRKSDLKTKVQKFVYRYISKPDVKQGINVLVIDNLQSFKDYIEKTGRTTNIPFTDLKEYVKMNYAMAQKIIEQNKKYRETAIKYSYDNYETWKKEFKKFKTPKDMFHHYYYTILKNDGKMPVNTFKLSCKFQSILVRMGIFDKECLPIPTMFDKFDSNFMADYVHNKMKDFSASSDSESD